MILEKETFEKFGYWPNELKSQSHKRIIVKCDECNKIRECYRYGYNELCKSCGRKKCNKPAWNRGLTKETDERVKIASEHMKGHASNETSFKKGHTPWHKGKTGVYSKEILKKMSESRLGIPTGRSPMKGKKHSEETIKKMSGKIPWNKGLKGYSIPWNKGLERNKETKEKISISRTGKCMGADNPNWKGGISNTEFEKRYNLTQREWKFLAKSVRERDNYICRYCGSPSAYDVHHIIPARIKINNPMNNLITLCYKCHPKVENLTIKCLEEGIDPISIFYEKWSEKE